MDEIKKKVSKKKSEGDKDFKRGKISFAAEAYRSALRLIESTPESKKQLKIIKQEDKSIMRAYQHLTHSAEDGQDESLKLPKWLYQ